MKFIKSCLEIIFVGIACSIACGPASRFEDKPVTLPGGVNETTVRLPNNWLLTPIGEHTPVGDLPLAIAIHPDGKFAAVTNGGYLPDYITIIDLTTQSEVQQVPVPHCWVGVEFAPDGRQLAVSITSRNTVYLYDFMGGQVALTDSIVLGQQDITEKIYPAGLVYTPDGRQLITANILQHTVSLIDVPGTRVLKSISCQSYPNYIRIHPDGDRAYVSSRGDNTIQVIALPEFQITHSIPVGSRPNHMTLSTDGARLFVACANSDDVYIIDTDTVDIVERIGLRPFTGARPGTTPNGLALTQDGTTLYVANADNNDVAVVDVSRTPAMVRGRLPVGWYPTAVALANNDGTLLVANGKGLTSKPNPTGPQPTESRKGKTHIAGLFSGTLSFIDLAAINGKTLAQYTATVERNNGWDRAQAAVEQGEPTAEPTVIPRRVGEPSKIKYVLYIIKENRTYDQIYGDLPQGNGDSSLCIFPEEITPNHHKIATTWVLFDNFYVDSEVSMDGHIWSTGAIAVDYLEKTWPSRYSNQGLFFTKRPHTGIWDILYEDVVHPDDGYIWNAALRAGLTIRNYWEMEEVAGEAGNLAPQAGVRDTTHWDFRKAEYYIKELREFEKNDNFPNFQIMALDNDHTQGTRPGRLTPQSCVGDNDHALGMIIDALSHSKFWPEMAVFVVEDDTQNGPDHVDAHRTVAMVASPYVRRGYVDHTQYSTVSMLKTMELILGLPPMTQYDAAAIPMVNAFMEEPDLTPYDLEPPRIDLSATNPAHAYGAAASMAMNLDVVDDLTIEEEQILNEVIWKSVKGPDSPMPKPVYWATRWVFGKPEEH
jgi:YVTN family beta-propeller protein